MANIFSKKNCLPAVPSFEVVVAAAVVAVPSGLAFAVESVVAEVDSHCFLAPFRAANFKNTMNIQNLDSQNMGSAKIRTCRSDFGC